MNGQVCKQWQTVNHFHSTSFFFGSHKLWNWNSAFDRLILLFLWRHLNDYSKIKEQKWPGVVEIFWINSQLKEQWAIEKTVELCTDVYALMNSRVHHSISKCVQSIKFVIVTTSVCILITSLNTKPLKPQLNPR